MPDDVSVDGKRRAALRELWPNLSVAAKAHVVFRAFGIVLRRPFTRTSWVVISSVVWTCFSVYLSVEHRDWSWFERSGSILTVAGAVLAARAIVREGRAGTRPPSPFFFGTVASTYYDEKTGKLMGRVHVSPEETRQRQQQGEDAAAIVVGFVFVVLGTIVWGYGVPMAKLLRVAPPNDLAEQCSTCPTTVPTQAAPSHPRD